MELRSQEVRTLAPENDPLKMGMGWKVEDLSKPQIMVESTFGDSHPGSAHLDQFVKEAVQAVNDNGGKAARYFATDMCDGIAQGHDGINYSLPHRDAIVNPVSYTHLDVYKRQRMMGRPSVTLTPSTAFHSCFSRS